MKTWLVRLCDKWVVAQVAVVLRFPRRRGRSEPPTTGPVVAIKLVGMGDAVLMLPALAAIRSAGRRLTVITTRRAAGVFTAPGVADGVVILGPRPASWRAAVRALRQAKTVLDFEQHVYWSGALAQAARRRTRRLGFRVRSRRRNYLYDVLVSPEGESGAVRHMKAIFDDLARAAGFAPAPELLSLPVSPPAATAAAQWRERNHIAPGGFVIFAPGSGATVQFRRLSAAVWAEVAAGFPDWPVAVVGGPLDEAVCRQIVDLVPRAVLATGFNLQELAALMAESAAVIAIDSGPMHLAAAMGVPVVGIFGPDTPQRYGPHRHSLSLPGATHPSPASGLGTPATPPTPPVGRLPLAAPASVYQGLPCSPCNNCWVYREARCTNPDAYACMTGIAAGEIISAAAVCLAARQSAHN